MADKRVSLSDRNTNQIGRAVSAFISTPQVSDDIAHDAELIEDVVANPIMETLAETITEVNDLTLVEAMVIPDTKPLVKPKVKPLMKTLCEDNSPDINRIVGQMVAELERILQEEKEGKGFQLQKTKEKFDVRNPSMAIPAKREIHDIMEHLAKRFKKYGLHKYQIFEKIFINGLKNTNFEE